MNSAKIKQEHLIATDAKTIERKAQIKACSMLFDFEQAQGKPGTINQIAKHYANQAWSEYDDEPAAKAILITDEIREKSALLSKALPALHHEGIVTVTGIERCELTGMMQQQWHLTAIGENAVKAYRGQ